MESISHNQLADEQLMKQYQHGTHTALETLYHRYSKPLLRFAFSMLNNDEQCAQDVLHDVFIALAERPQRFDTNRSFKPWIYAVVANACRKQHRKPESVNTEMLEEQEAPDSSYTNDIDKRLFKQALKTELSQLSYQHRCTFILRYNEQLSILDISDVMQCSQGTVKSRIHYCLKHLSKKLHQFNPANIH